MKQKKCFYDAAFLLLAGGAALMFFSAFFPVQAQQKNNPRLLRKTYESEILDTKRAYWVYLPAGFEQSADKQWPVMLFLHGNGERGNDLSRVLIHGPLMEAVEKGRDLPFIIIAPQLPNFPDDFQRSPRTYQWDHSKRKPIERKTLGIPQRTEDGNLPYGWDMIADDLLFMINETVEAYNGDRDRIYVTGLSYGGYGTWYMASHHADLFAAAAPICGAGNPATIAGAGNLPVWLFQGGKDDVILPEWSLEMADSLEAAGGNVRVTVYEDLWHNSWERAYSGKDLYDWLLSHRRSDR